MALVKFFETLQGSDATAARGSVSGIPNITSDTTDIYTFGWSKKNDGGAAHYKRYDTAQPQFKTFSFDDDNTTVGHWGLVSEDGMITPLQAGASGNGSANEQAILQACIDFVARWNTTTTSGTTANGLDSDRHAIKLVIPANRTFQIDTTDPLTHNHGLVITGPITIEGENRDTSRFKLKENDTNADNLFFCNTTNNVIFRNFTMEGSYQGQLTDAGNVQLISFDTVDGVLLDSITCTHNRGVIIGGQRVRNLTMRGSLLSESRHGGMVVSDVVNVTIEDNDFRWVPDDPIAFTITNIAADPLYNLDGGMIRVVGNRIFGSRGININGAKNVLIESNTHTLGRGRAVHVGTTTFQQKGDSSSLNIIIRNNIIVDLLDPRVDPRSPTDNGGHRAIDIELLVPGKGTLNAIPGFPISGTMTPADGTTDDPTQYYYGFHQGLQNTSPWTPSTHYNDGDMCWVDGYTYIVAPGDHGNSASSAATPPRPPFVSGKIHDNGSLYWTLSNVVSTPPGTNIVIEGNIVTRTRPHADGTAGGLANFTAYNVGLYGGSIGYPNAYNSNAPVLVPIDYITPTEGIGVSGAVRGLAIRGNRLDGCDTCILFYGKAIPSPFSLLDVAIVDNDLSDWGLYGIHFTGYAGGWAASPPVQPQRVSILNNRANGDPFFRCNARSTGGTWYDRIGGTFIYPEGVSPLVIMGNHVRNVSRLVDGVDAAPPVDHVMEGNVAYCKPTAIGWNASNIGIGRLLRPQLGWRYIIEEGNPTVIPGPTVPACGAVLNICPLGIGLTSAPALSDVPPDTGIWVEGTYVVNLNPGPLTAGSNTIEIAGWRRMTTGTGNALNTNWRQQRVLTA